MVYSKKSNIVIWQTYKTKNLPKDAKKCHESWKNVNPNCDVVLWDDAEITNYMKQYWSEDMNLFFKTVPLGVMKADIWRYCILKTHGGLYTDVDTVAKVPVTTWLQNYPFTSSMKHVLFVSLENDDHFCQWTIYATQEHPAMRFVCQHIVTNYKYSRSSPKEEHYVHKTTGPAIWTEGLVLYLKQRHRTPGELYRLQEADPAFQEYLHSKGVHILPWAAFGREYSENLYGSQNFNDGYVKWIEEVKALE